MITNNASCIEYFAGYERVKLQPGTRESEAIYGARAHDIYISSTSSYKYTPLSRMQRAISAVCLVAPLALPFLRNHCYKAEHMAEHLAVRRDCICTCV